MKKAQTSLLNKYFPDIFLINLDRDTKRLEIVDKKLTDLSITYKRIQAYDGQILKFMENSNYGGQFLSGYIGCSLSHFHCLQLAKDLNLDNVLILEDDIKIHKELDLLLELSMQQLKNDNIDWNILFLGYFLCDTISSVNWKWHSYNYPRSYICLDKYHYPLRSEHSNLDIYGLHSYVVKSTVYDIILEESKTPLLDNFDIMLFKKMRTGELNKVYGVVPQLFIQDETFLNTTHQNTDFKLDMKNMINKYHSVYEDYR